MAAIHIMAMILRMAKVNIYVVFFKETVTGPGSKRKEVCVTARVDEIVYRQMNLLDILIEISKVLS